MGQHETQERWYLIILGIETEEKRFIMGIEAKTYMYSGSKVVTALTKEEAIEKALMDRFGNRNKKYIVLDTFDCGVSTQPYRIQ